ncbi:pyridoxamine 5'-phosphate oxidase family protein [Rubrivivax sp. RP6-9]|uniref:pyridoxamine 5'-phosphate oxidase family protein n=1 Tax=Rubrivivax sp. RP6-9 TaxID=3415750 RepID=UPI003CC587DC
MSRPPPPFTLATALPKVGITAYASDVAFTDTVKAIQARKGSRPAYARMEVGGSWASSITADLKAEIEAQTSVFLATANAEGQPYIQHRGGPAGFLRVLDEHTIAFVDFAGNRQYITQGNLEENPKAQLFLIDYAHRRRIKVWGTARVVEGDEPLLRSLMPEGYPARPEQVVLFTVTAWDVNCPQHIPQRFGSADVEAAIKSREERIAALEAEVERLRRARTTSAS